MPRTKSSRSSLRSSSRSHPGTRSRSSSSRNAAGAGRGRRSPGQTSGRAGGAAKRTTNHEFIRRWAEDRGGQPACVRGTGGPDDTGMLRIDFPGYSGQRSLQHIDWDEWFEKFDEKNLALLYQDRTKGGRKSNFNKLVER